MRLEKHDVDVLLPLALTMLSKKGNLQVTTLDYLLEENRIALKTELLYAGLPVRFEGIFRFFTNKGAIGMEVQKNNIDSLLIKGDALPFLKTIIKSNEYLFFKENNIYFYHSKMPVKEIKIDEEGIELSFTSIEKER